MRSADKGGHVVVASTMMRPGLWIRGYDTMQEWFESGACDGFNITPATLPGGGEEFVEMVLPELRRRGLFRSDYEGTTSREILGLRPAVNRYGG